MKKLLLVIPFVALTVLAYGCGSTSAPSVSATTSITPAVGTVAQAQPRSAAVTLPPTGTVSEPSADVMSVSVISEKDTVAVGDTFEVVVALDLLDAKSRGAECGLAWTPADLVECSKVEDGDYLADFQTMRLGASGTKAIHNNIGSVENIGLIITDGNTDAGVSGQGILFIYTFTAKAKGKVNFSVPEGSLTISDMTGDDSLPINVFNNTTVTIQ